MQDKGKGSIAWKKESSLLLNYICGYKTKVICLNPYE